MEQRIELLLADGTTLDVSGKFGIPLTYHIDDIKNISSTNGSFSKTIVLPGTKNNNNILGLLLDINSDFTFFNPNIKTPAKLIIDYVTVLDGFFQLKNIRKNLVTDLEGNEIQYEILMSENFTDFFGEIKNKLITNNIDPADNLDFSEFDHTLSYDNLITSFSHTWENGYANFVGSKHIDRYGASDFKPAIFYKQYLLKIAQHYGYELGGSFMTDENFEKEIIPYNGDVYSADTVTLSQREFNAGLPSDETSAHTFTFSYNSNNTFNSGNRDGIYTDDSTDPFFDNGSNWNTSTSQWVVNESGIYSLEATQSLKLTMVSTRDAYLRSPNVLPPAIVMEVRAFINGFAVGTSITNTYIDQQGKEQIGERIMPHGSGALFNAGNSFTQTFETSTITKELFQNGLLRAGDIITIKYKTYLTLGLAARYVGVEDPHSLDFIDFSMTMEPQNASLRNTAESYSYQEGDTVFINSFLPTNAKISDLFDDIQRRYNLVFRTDPNNNKKLLIDSRDFYYSQGETVDWTNKVDYTNQEILLLSDLQDKKVEFSYTNDNAFWSEYYSNATDGDVYGMKKIEYTNEFSDSTKQVTSPFAPTAMIYSPDDIMIVPDIPTEAPKSGLKTLYFQGLQPVLEGEFILWNGATQQTTGLATYPAASHFDDNINPSIDLNFGANNFYYYEELSATSNNTQFGRYWSNTINQIAVGKMLKTRMNLDLVDIGKLKDNLNLKIWIKDAFYNINKVIDFNASDNSLTSVELIKFEPFVVWSPTDPNVTSGANLLTRKLTSKIENSLIVDGVEGGGLKEFNHSTLSATTDSGATQSGTGGVIGSGSRDGSLQTSKNANKNQILSPDAIVTGESNLVGKDTESIIVSGNRNLVQPISKNSGILGGNDNTIEAGVENGWLIGVNNKTITQSDEVWIGESIHIKNGALITSFNLLEGGFNELRTLFPTSTINLVEGGEDEIRAPFATNNINLIDGGLDSI